MNLVAVDCVPMFGPCNHLGRNEGDRRFEGNYTLINTLMVGGPTGLCTCLNCLAKIGLRLWFHMWQLCLHLLKGGLRTHSCCSAFPLQPLTGSVWCCPLLLLLLGLMRACYTAKSIFFCVLAELVFCQVSEMHWLLKGV